MASARPRRRPRTLLSYTLLVILLASLRAGATADRALAEACPGSGPGPCPYATAQIIGQRAEGVLRFPEAVALDARAAGGGQGDVYVADQLSYVVQKFTTAGVFETEWGSYGGGNGQFGPIGGLATDDAGNVYVVDSSHDRIEKFDSNGNFITAWGHAGSELGQFHFYSSQNPTQPPGGGIAVTGSFVYVADSGNNRIQRFSLEGTEAMQWGTKGSGPGQFTYPRALAANENEVIVADDDNHRVEKFDPNGVFQAAAGSQGAGSGHFGFPYGVTLDAGGDVYVADDINHRIVKLGPELAFIGEWGEFGSRPGQLAFPRALASDPAGYTYVADTANDRIQVFDPEGGHARTLGASGRALGAMTAPRGVAVDPSGRLIVADTVGSRIELFSPVGPGFAGVWQIAGGYRAGFRGPAGIGIDPRGLVYLADAGNERIVRLWGDGTFLSELGGPAIIGGAQLSGVSGVAVRASSGQIYVADANHNRVLTYGPEGSLLAKWGAGGGDGTAGSGPGEFDHPAAVAVDGTGEVYVADKGNDRIVELAPGGGVLRQWGSRGSSDGRFHAPAGVALDAAGNVYVLDSENNRVEVFDPGGRLLEKWGLRGAGLGEFSQPRAIAVDCAGGVEVADTNNNRVERFTSVAPAATACQAPGSWPGPLDVAPVLRVSLQRHSGVLARRALALSVGCQRGCKVLVTATLAPRGRGGAVRLIAAARVLPRAIPAPVRLRIGRAALRRLRRVLGPRGAMTARVRILAAGPTGRRTTVALTYAVAR